MPGARTRTGTTVGVGTGDKGNRRAETRASYHMQQNAECRMQTTSQARRALRRGACGVKSELGAGRVGGAWRGGAGQSSRQSSYGRVGVGRSGGGGAEGGACRLGVGMWVSPYRGMGRRSLSAAGVGQHVRRGRGAGRRPAARAWGVVGWLWRRGVRWCGIGGRRGSQGGKPRCAGWTRGTDGRGSRVAVHTLGPRRAKAWRGACRCPRVGKGPHLREGGLGGDSSSSSGGGGWAAGVLGSRASLLTRAAAVAAVARGAHGPVEVVAVRAHPAALGRVRGVGRRRVRRGRGTGVVVWWRQGRGR